jgi:hypothetical protein
MHMPSLARLAGLCLWVVRLHNTFNVIIIACELMDELFQQHRSPMVQEAPQGTDTVTTCSTC